MAAAGCGLAAGASAGGPACTTTARGRFPGRPWTSRSRLRLDRRSQLGRLGVIDGEAAAGGPRPSISGLSLSEDPSLLRLLGIAENHKRQGAAGYSSSGSEEGEDFKGFETETENIPSPLRSGHRFSISHSPKKKVFKRTQQKPPPAPDLETSTESRAPKKGSKPSQGTKQVSLTAKPRNNRRNSTKSNNPKQTKIKGMQLGVRSAQGLQRGKSTSKITLKLAAKKGRKDISPIQKRTKRSEDQVVGNIVVTKKGNTGVGKLSKDRDRIKLVSPKTKLGSGLTSKGTKFNSGRRGSKGEFVDQKCKISLPRCEFVPKNKCPVSQIKNKAGKTKKLNTVDVGPDKQTQCNRSALGLELNQHLTEALEGENTEESKEELSSKDAEDSELVIRTGKRNQGSTRQHKQGPESRATQGAESVSTAVNPDTSVPGLKLKRVRSSKALFSSPVKPSLRSSSLKGFSRKKQSKFIWTLTLMKGKKKAVRVQESRNSVKAGRKEDEEKSQDVVLHTEQTGHKDAALGLSQRGITLVPEDTGTDSIGLEMEEMMEACSEGDFVVGKVVVSPLKLKVVSSSDKQTLQPSLLIQQVGTALVDKDLVMKNISEDPQDWSTFSEVTCPHVPKAAPKLAKRNLPSLRRKPGHKRRTQRKPKQKENVVCLSCPQGLRKESSEPDEKTGELSDDKKSLPEIKSEFSMPTDSVEYASSVAETEPRIDSEIPVAEDRGILALESALAEQAETHSGEKPIKQKRRKSVFGYRRKLGFNKASTENSSQKVKRSRRRQVTFTSVDLDATEDTIKEAAKDQMEQDQQMLSREAQQGGCLKSTRHFIMPVVSARSSRVIKTPKRFMDDEDMSVLPPRIYPKKASPFLQAPSGTLGTSAAEDLFPDLSQQEDFLKESLFESEDAEVSQLIGSDCDPRPSDPAPSSLPRKRRSVLREPNFTWLDLEESTAEIFTLNQLKGQDSRNPFSEDAFQDPNLNAANDIASSKGEMHLKVPEKRKKLSQGQKKVKEPFYKTCRLDSELVEQNEADVQDSSLKESSSLKKKKAKLKMEDMDSPGVVRRVAVHLRGAHRKSSWLEYEAALEHEEMNVNEYSARQSVKGEYIPLSVSEDPEINQSSKAERVKKNKSTSHRSCLTGANKKMLHLLRKAKVQLMKIDQQKQLKSSQLLSQSASVGNHDKESEDVKRGEMKTSLTELSTESRAPGGPRIKHVCRDAAVALGQPRALVPDDVPRLSALPLHERDGITPFTAVEELGSPSEPESPVLQDCKVSKVRKPGRGASGRFGRDYGPSGNRSRRCGKCKGCLHEDDCGRCMNCLDKPKFGGPNTKRQCCVYKRCARIEARKAQRLGYKLYKEQIKRPWSTVSACLSSEEEGEEEGKEGEGKTGAALAPPADSQSASVRRQPLRGVKPRSYCDLLPSDSDSDLELVGRPFYVSPSKRRALSSRTQEGTPRHDTPDGDCARQRRPCASRGPVGRRRMERGPLEQTPASVLAALANGFSQREQEPPESTHKICVDFKEDCSIQNVWLLGGLSVLTSLPVIPPILCLLCASKGQHQMLFCQVCCEPFHWFCLEPEERPLVENKDKWCCRRCKFCHVCGRRNKHSKALIECERCQNCYHPSCLGPNYPNPSKWKKAWVCMTCVRCKSCGATPGTNWETEWNHEKDLCPDCKKLYEQGNFCPVCFGCYEDDDYTSQMIQCAECSHWVHAKCESLSDDLYKMLSSLPDSVVYICEPCSHDQASTWREQLMSELKERLGKLLASMRNSSLTQHLLCHRESTPLPDPLNLKDQLAVDLQTVNMKFEDGFYSTLELFHEDMIQMFQKWLEEEDALPWEQNSSALARSFYLHLMEEEFPWFSSQDAKEWDPRSKDVLNGMLPYAVPPPSSEHVYAQWRVREGQASGRARGGLETHAAATSDPRDLSGSGRRFQGKMENISSSVEDDWSKEDERQCALCQKYGDAKPNDAGRLLYLGQNEWAHVNCSLWSAEVFEDDGSLMHVHSAVTRGRLMRCEGCHQTGATVGCCLTSCQSNYHFMCARTHNCVFQDDKRVFCYKHRDLISDKMVTEDGFEVLRRVFVDFEGISLRRKFLTGLEPECINMMIGSLTIQKLGILTEVSASQGKLFPVGYQCSRWYWSTVDPRRRCRYTFTVKEVRPPLLEKLVEDTSDQGENQTIAHSPSHSSECEASDEAKIPVMSDTRADSPATQPKVGALHRPPAYPQSRRPAGGTPRPLPFPGNSSTKSHHVLTVSDLEEARRMRRHCSVPRGAQSRFESSSSGFRIEGGSPSKISASASLDEAESQLTSFQCSDRGASPHSVGDIARAPSVLLPQRPRPGILSSSSTARSYLSCPQKMGQLDTSEGPHGFLTSPETGDITEANRTLLSPVSSALAHENISQLPFEPEMPAASLFSANLDLDDVLQREGHLAVDREGQLSSGWLRDGENTAAERPAAVQVSPLSVTPARAQGESALCDEDRQTYVNFQRTEITYASSRDPDVALPSSGSIPQLDGADDGTESDSSNDENQSLKSTKQAQTQLPTQPAADISQKSRENYREAATTVCEEVVPLPEVKSHFSGALSQDLHPVTFGKDEPIRRDGSISLPAVGTQNSATEAVILTECSSDYRPSPQQLSVDNSDGVYAAADLILHKEQTLTETITNSSVVQETLFVNEPGVIPGLASGLESGRQSERLFLTEVGTVCDRISNGSQLTEVDGKIVLDPSTGPFVCETVPPSPSPALVNTSTPLPIPTPSSKFTSRPYVALDSSSGLVVPVFQSPLKQSREPPSQPSSSRSLPSASTSCSSQARPLKVQFNTYGSLTAPPSHVGTSVSTVTILSPSHSVTTSSFARLGTKISLPVVINGYNAAPVQEEISGGVAIPVSVSVSKAVVETRPQLVTQVVPGHTIHMGRSLVSTNSVLLVNSVGQFFLKESENGTFQASSVSSPSRGCTSQISQPVMASPPSSRHIVTYSSLGAARAQSPEVLVPKDKKQRRKRTEITPGSLTAAISDRHESTAHAGGVSVTLNPSPARILGPPQFHVNPVQSKVQALGSVPLQPTLFKESKPAVVGPRPHARVKRVSSLSDRAGSKKPKSDLKLEHSNVPELGSASGAGRSSGVRMKAPSVKNLPDRAKPEKDSLEEMRIDPGDHTSSSAQGNHSSQAKALSLDCSRRTGPIDWGSYSGAASSSDEATSDPEEQQLNGHERPHLRFQITSEDGFSVEADTIEVAWKAVIEGVLEARAGCLLPQLSFMGRNGARMLGVVHDAVIFLLEQLQGAARCRKHSFRFHKQENQEEELPINPTGCARSEVYLRKSTFDMFNFLASQHRQLPDPGPYDEEEDDVLLKSTRRATSLELPMAMRFRHLERTSKEAVGVYRSAIHGRGLFCKRNIDAGEMVIEYSGTVIRAVLTDKREKYYESKGIGCYMFRMDDFEVVDATMHGNAARFINHSCEPNCYSRVINVEGQKHIVIFALRKIYRGEELTYDYKFPIEDASNKLGCNCGAKRCRHFLN
ncbi:histone-lysine N-methyltransferase 2B-like isoform X2 [Paramormyrops kingsleyae]|uniref:histone-lysine N-methyltransferase 2B-like isoform X2 n=1 Tax=Paramormyrops kingsleyae TaxID=1676925 RepID=UPI003B973C6C